MTQIVSADSEGIDRAVELLRQEEVVAIPTETVYGLAGSALSEAALLRIFAAKERPLFDPLITHIALPPRIVNMLDYIERSGLVDLRDLTAAARNRLEDLLSVFWPGALTVVLPRALGVLDLLTSGLPRIALRMPVHPVAQAILERVGLPLAAPSANRFGRISPTTAQAVYEELAGRIPLIIDGGATPLGLESTIIALEEDEQFVLLRPGSIPKERIEARLGVRLPVRIEGSEAPESPGQLPNHYAPERPLQLIDSIAQIDLSDGTPIGLLTWKPLGINLPATVTALSLTTTGSVEEAARNLFALLRALDKAPCVRLYVERCPISDGLGHAINDRLNRAAHSSAHTAALK